MKKKYLFKPVLMLLFTAFIFVQTHAQIRIVQVDTSTESVTIHNYGGSTVNISSYYLCNFPDYKILSGMSITNGTLNLVAGTDVTVTSTVVLDNANGELGLYLNNSNFGNSANMLDYMQWGNAGHTRESVAVSAGVWPSGDFINIAPPYEYTGDGSGSQIGDSFWGTVLGIKDFENNITFTISPNPTTSILNIQLSKSFIDGNVKVFDVLGKHILTKEINSNHLTQLDVSNISKGLYLVKVSTGKNIQTKRFIKK